jgi:hypothetical protein
MLTKQKLPSEESEATSTSSASEKTSMTTAAIVSSSAKKPVAKKPFAETGSGSESVVPAVDAAKDAAVGISAEEMAETKSQGGRADASTSEQLTEPPLDKEAALRAQDLYFKKTRRHRFKMALLSGLGRGVGSATLDVGDLLEHHDHDGGDNSEPDDSDVDFDDLAHNGQHKQDDTQNASQGHDPVDRSGTFPSLSTWIWTD